VSVAVLLDNFINHTIKVEEEDKRRKQAEQRSSAEVRRESWKIATNIHWGGDDLAGGVLHIWRWNPLPQCAQVASPIAPLLTPLLKGHIDDTNLSSKIARLFEVARRAAPSKLFKLNQQSTIKFAKQQ
jgi:hypothetical protein